MARWKYRTQEIEKMLPSVHHFCTTLPGCIFATKERIDNRKKNPLNRNIFPKCAHNMLNFGAQTAEINFVWSTPANLNGFRVLALLLQRYRSPEANQTLHNLWPSPQLVGTLYIYIFGGSCHLMEFCLVQKSLCVLLYWQHYCTALDQWASATFLCVQELVSWSITSLFSTNMAISEMNGHSLERTPSSPLFPAGIISLVIMCIGIIGNNSFSRRTRLGWGSNRTPATANVTLYCTWRPSDLTTGLHGQVCVYKKWNYGTHHHFQQRAPPTFQRRLSCCA